MKLIYLLLGALAALQLVDARKLRILDEEEEFEVENVAKKVCWTESGSRNQISKFSTLARLARYFRALPMEHEFSSCAKHNLEPLEALLNLTSTGNENVCSEDKVNAIESFHHRYLGGPYTRRTTELPRVLHIFFLQYASYLNTVCAIRSYEYFEQKLAGARSLELPETDELLNEYTRNLGVRKQLASYDDLYLVWGLVNGLPKKTYARLSEYLLTGPKKLVLKIWNAKSLREVQEVCSKSLRPLYSQTLLPTLRLADLGYYPATPHFLEQVRDNTFVNRLYKLTLLCETMLPICALDNERSDLQSYLMKPIDLDPEELQAPTYSVPEFIAPANLEGVDQIPLGTPEQAFKQAGRVKANLASRKRALAKVVKFVAKNMKKHPYKSTKLWGTNQSIDAMAKEVGDKVNWLEPQPERRKRSLKSFAGGLILFFQNAVFVLVMGVFFIIDLVMSIMVAIPAIVYGVMAFIRNGFTGLGDVMLDIISDKDWAPKSWADAPKNQTIEVTPAPEQ